MYELGIAVPDVTLLRDSLRILTDSVRLPDALAFRLRLWNERSGMEGQPTEALVAAAAEVWEAELKELSTQKSGEPCRRSESVLAATWSSTSATVSRKAGS